MSSSHANTLCHINTKENLVCFLKTQREGKVIKPRIDDPLNNRLQERTITFVHYKLYLIVARSCGRVREMDVYFLIQEVAVMNTCVVTTAVTEVRFPGTFFQKKLWRNVLLAREKKSVFYSAVYTLSLKEVVQFVEESPFSFSSYKRIHISLRPNISLLETLFGHL